MMIAMKPVPNKVIALIALIACFLSIAGPCNGRGEPVEVTVRPAGFSLPPPTELTLMASGTNDLRLDYVRSDWVGRASHHYRFELIQANERRGTYQHHETINDSESPAYFHHLSTGYWYRARGQRCTTYKGTLCGGWSDYSVPVKMMPLPTGLRENLPASGPHTEIGEQSFGYTAGRLKKTDVG